MATLVKYTTDENEVRILYEYLAEASVVFPKVRVFKETFCRCLKFHVYIGVPRDPLAAGRQDHERVVAVSRQDDPGRGAEHHREHGELRGHQPAAAPLPAELRLRRTLEVRRTLHQVKLQRGERGAVRQLPGGAGGDLPAPGRGGARAEPVPEHALRVEHRRQLQHQALLLPHQHLPGLAHRESSQQPLLRTDTCPLLFPVRLDTSNI